MGTQVQIQLTLDSSGAVTGISRLGSSFDDLNSRANNTGKKAGEAFNGIESAERRAHIAGTLFTRLTGVEMPRALETVISRSKILGPLMAGAFNVAVIASATQAVFGFVEGIVDAARSLGGMNAAVEKMHAEAVAASNDALANPKTLANARANLSTQEQVVSQISKQAELYKSADVAAKAGLKTLVTVYPGIFQDIEDIVNSQDRLNAANKVFGELQKNDVVLVRAVRDANLASQAEINEAGLKGFRLIQQQRIDQDTLAKASYDFQSGMSDALAAKIKSNTAKETAATMELWRSVEEETLRMEATSIESQLQGDAKIRESIGNRLRFMELAFVKETGFSIQQAHDIPRLNEELTRRTNAIISDGEHQRIEMHRQTMVKIREMEVEAAVASLPEWQRAEAQIIAEHSKTTDELKHQLDAQLINQTEFNRGVASSDRVMNAHLMDEHKRMAEALGSDLESAFDDMTNGNIGKRILANLKKFFFQIVAHWVLSMNIMKSTFGQLAGIALFGPGSTGANVFGGGSSIIGGIANATGGGNSSGSSSGSGTGGGGAFSSVVPAGGGGGTGFSLPGVGVGTGLAGALPGTGVTSSSGAGGASASSALTSATIAQATGAGLADSGAMSIASSGRKAGGVRGLFNLNTLAGLAPMGAMLLGAAGGKIGSIGGLITSLLLTGKLGGLIQPLTLGAGTLGTAAVSALVGGLTGGLIGFGVGTNSGGLLGSLAGAGTGALTGLMVGGPIGALVGGLIGLLGGIFGGIFGGSKRNKQANAFADNTVIPDITQIVQGFDSFQIDNSAAIQQLEQLRTDAQKQLSALRGEGKSVFNNKVMPAIDDAEKHIRSIETERERRAAIVFGPAQFHDGGMAVRGFGRLRANELPAVLEHGEFVVNKQATAKNRAALENMNAGGSAGALHIGGDLNIITRNLDRDYVNSSQFKDDVIKALWRARMEGH